MTVSYLNCIEDPVQKYRNEYVLRYEVYTSGELDRIKIKLQFVPDREQLNATFITTTIIEKCREAESSEVKWTKRSEVEWGEVKFSIGKVGGGRVFMEKVYRSVVSDEKWRTVAKAWVN